MSPSRKPVRDIELFAAVMRDVKPLRKKKPAPLHARSRHAEPVSAPSRERVAIRVSRPPKPAAVSPPPNPGIDRRTAERLRKGAMSIDQRIDLHGMTEAAAHAALDRFVRLAWHRGARVLLVITGKGSTAQGGGVLRRNLPRWLTVGENAARVLRVESAQPRDGGSGAYYILLRRRRET
jgi:DNA-nicking Smr family endonuclease